MSIHYSPELVKLLMEERLSAARKARALHCCEELAEFAAAEPRRVANLVRNLFRRQSPAACTC